MRVLPILTAVLVAVTLYALVFERDRLLGFAQEATPAAILAEDGTATDAPPIVDAAAAEAAERAAEDADEGGLPDGVVRVMAQHSVAEEVDSAVILRGETEALREVEVRAETDGKIVSEPLRRGAFVEAGQLLCEIDPGTRGVSRQEAEARLAEARSRLPESRARLAEAEAQIPAARARIAEAEAGVPAAEAGLAEARAGLPAAQARLIEAQARVPEAEARLVEARARVPAVEARLEEARARVPEAQARLAEAEARVPAAEAALKEAEARVPAAEAALREAEARAPEATARIAEAEARVREAEINLNAAQSLSQDGFSSQTRLAAAEAVFEASKAQLQTAKSGVEGASAGIEAAKGTVEGARAAVESAKSQVAAAKAGIASAASQIRNAEAGVQSAQSDVEAAKAGVQAAQSQLENARAGIETARSQIEGSSAAVESALSRIEGARAAVISANAQLEGALAGVESARSGEENALAGIQAAQAGLAAADKEIERLQVHAPFGGLLETDTAELGALMQPGSACATVIQLDPIKIVAFVPETEVSRVNLGARAGARLTDAREVVGEVTFVSRSADPVTRTFRIELTVANDDLSIRDGQTAEIAIEADGAPAHFLPSSALTLNDEGALGVRTVTTDDTAKFLPVTLVRDTREGVWLAGLPDQVDVITVGQEFVTDGVTVAPSFEEVIQ